MSIGTPKNCYPSGELQIRCQLSSPLTMFARIMPGRSIQTAVWKSSDRKGLHNQQIRSCIIKFAI